MDQGENSSIPYLLMVLPKLMKKLFKTEEQPPPQGEYRLNRTHMKALFFISHMPSPNMTQVCDHINMEKGSLTPVIDTLIDSGLVERRRDEKDRRRVNLYLTTEGERVRGMYEKWFFSKIEEAVSILTEPEKEDLRMILIKLNKLAEKL